jgi:spore maturation protein B
MSVSFSEQIGNYILLFFMVGIPVYAYCKKVPVYETFIEGAKGGFPLFLKIMPYMLAMLVAISMLRASGALDLLTQAILPVLQFFGITSDIAPIAILRPFSSAAATAGVANVIHSQGANSYSAHLAAIVASTSDATFFIVAIYFGAANIRNTRHAILSSIIVDLVGMFSAVWISCWFLQK